MNTAVFEEFLGDYSLELTGSFIAKKKKLNQKTTANYLQNLEKEGILKSKTQGKNKNYFLNLENREIIKNFILAVEHLRTIEFYEKSLVIKEISEKIRERINGSALIFGSYAKRIQKKDSDLDIMILGNCNEKEIVKIGNMYNIEISLKIYSEFKKDTLMQEAIKNHIFIKNSEQVIEEILNDDN
jgi:predicted nucleotidyltransferase/predicted transcriptional regulator